MINIVIYGSDERFLRTLELESLEVCENINDVRIRVLCAGEKSGLTRIYDVLFNELSDERTIFIGDGDFLSRRDERNLTKLMANFEKVGICSILYGKDRCTLDSKTYPHLKRYFQAPFSLAEYASELFSLVVCTHDEAASEVGEKCGEIIFDSEHNTVGIDGRLCRLTAREYELFCVLYESLGTPVSRSELTRRVWGDDTTGNVCDVYVTYLRKKLSDAELPLRIKSVRGFGYVIV